jgi:diguanylate cyclase (GGDEF)-like protein/PAS domain S-box-containing protein
MPDDSTLEALLAENAALKAEIERLRRAVAPSDATPSDHETIEQLRRQLANVRMAEDQLRLIGSVVETSADGILILTPAVEETGPRIAFANDAFSRITGIARRRTMAETLAVLNLARGDRPLVDGLLAAIFAGEPFEGESLAFRDDGSEYSVEIKAVPIRDATAFITHWIVFVRDVSSRREQILNLERKAQIDALTDLPNRLLLFDRLEQAVLLHRRSQKPVGLMIMDLDRFKEVNDGFGHHYGDLLLKQVAFRLRQLVRQSDTIARLGGDEFAIVLPQVASEHAAMEVAQKILRAFETPFAVADRTFSIAASVGIALCPQHGEDGATLLRRADIAMYRAKQSGSEFCLYSAEHDRDPAGRYELIAGLREAIEREQLVLHYQPKIDLRTRTLGGAEALVRWRHPNEGLLYPDRFIHLAETSGLMKPMTAWILNDAVRQIRKWRDDGLLIQVAVNLSPVMLRDATVPENVAGILENWDIAPQWLKIEITESSIMADPAQAMAVLSLLRTLGVSVSIDDFGTGYSSLANLRQIPFDEIKIDKSFVTDMLTNDSDAAIVRATIDLAHNLGREVIAEGVENQETLRRLAEWGCDLAQGYFISRPIEPQKFMEWVAQTRTAGVSSVD